MDRKKVEDILGSTRDRPIIDTNIDINEWAEPQAQHTSLKEKYSCRLIYFTINTQKDWFTLSTTEKERYRQFLAKAFGNGELFAKSFIKYFPISADNKIDTSVPGILIKDEDLYFVDIKAVPEVGSSRSGHRLHIGGSIELINTNYPGYITIFDTGGFMELWRKCFGTNCYCKPYGNFNKRLYMALYINKNNLGIDK